MQEALWWLDEPKGKAPTRKTVLPHDIERITSVSDWKPVTELPALPDRFALDFETHDPGIVGRTGSCWPKRGVGEAVGVAVATATGQFYVPFGHRGGDNSHDAETVFRWLRAQVSRETTEIVFANANYDLGWLERHDCTPRGKVFDVQIEAALLDENRFTYALDALAREYLGTSKDETLLKAAAREAGFGSAKGDLWQLPARFVGPYAERDARATYDLHAHFVPLIEAEDLTEVWRLETEIIPQVVAMRRRGIRVDLDRAAATAQAMAAEERDLILRLYERTGVHVSAWDNEAMGRALSTAGIALPKTVTGRASVTKAALTDLPGELPEMCRRIRKLSKVRGTFIEGYILGMHHEGRIHAEFAQLRRTSDVGGNSGTVSGRFSSDSPNLQNIPSDKEFGSIVRALFLPEEGELFASVDYASQEPRWLVHFASLAKCRGAAKAVREFHANRKVDYHQMTADITGLERKEAKAINLGITYGMKGKTFCLNNHLPTQWMRIEDGENGRKIWHEIDEAERFKYQAEGETCVEVAGKEGKRMLDAYHKNLPFVREMMDLCSDVANRRGYILTHAKRRCRFRMDSRSGERIQTHAALNRLCQGSSADQTKYAMRDLWREGVVPLLTEHDELCFSVHNIELAQHFAYIMENAVPMEVPSVCDLAIGANWGECGD